MDYVFRLAGYAGIVLLSGFAAVVLWKILAGQINLDGLLDARDSQGRRSFSPARLQLLGISILGAASYVSDVIAFPSDVMPAPSTELLAAIGASQLTFLGAKGFFAWIRPVLGNLK